MTNVIERSPKTKMQGVTARAFAASGEPPAAGTRGMFRLGDLVATPLNVRKNLRTPEEVRSMAVTIAAHGGVLQNLLLVAELDDEGWWTGKLGAVAGETRRLALVLLRDGAIENVDGFSDDTLVPGLIVAHPEATALSPTENAQRTARHPADEFVAFKALVDDCGSIEHVAAMYGVEPGVVERRLRLANAAPRLFQLYRDAGITLDQLMALCLTEDHALQEKVWNAARGEWYRQPSQLRAMLTRDQISLTRDPVACFVGVEAYEPAGGVVMRDLFSDQGEGFIADKMLLLRLATEKLEAQAAQVAAEGWAWTETRLNMDYASRSAFGQCELTKKKPSADMTTRLKALRADLGAKRRQIERSNDDEPVLRRDCDTLQARIAEIEGSRAGVSDVERPFAGALVCLDQHGNVEVLRGLVKPEDRKAVAKALKQDKVAREREQRAKDAGGDGLAANAGRPPQDSQDGAAAAESEASWPDAVSRPLSLLLGAHRTAALQLLVANNTRLALALLAHTMVNDVFGLCSTLGHDPVHVSSTAQRGDVLLRGEASVRGARAAREFDQILHAWEERLPQEGLLAWLIDLPQEELLALIGVCCAATINTVPTPMFEARAMGGHALDIATSAGLHMADWWAPTGDNYLGKVSKAHILSVLGSVAGAEACAGLDKLAKGELVAKAEALLAGKRWLPPLLRLDAKR